MRRLIIILYVICMVSLLPAQNTTTSLRGRVKDSEGVLVAAIVNARHLSSGSNYYAITNQEGYYHLDGMRVGEYTVEVSYVGYETVKTGTIHLSLGESPLLDFVMGYDLKELQGVTIMAERSHFMETKTGAAIRVESGQIKALPSLNRSILDYTRLSPYSGLDNSMAGRDGRLTTLTIDGANLNNSFGISSALPGAGSPVSIYAIDEVQVVVAPYDVRQSNFTGGGINAITKSGTNALHADYHFNYSGSQLRGNSIDGNWMGEREKEYKMSESLNISFPIIRDRLFLFMNLETGTSPAPISKWKLSEDGVARPENMVSRVTQAEMDEFSSLLEERGYSAGGADLSEGGVTDRKLLIRMDWNINDRHNLMLRYNLTRNNSWLTPNDRSTVGASASSNRVGDQAYTFKNSCYKVADNAYSAVAELNSHFSKNLNNRLIATVSNVNNMRGSSSSLFPYIDIWDGEGNIKMSAGYEPFSYNTGNQTVTLSLKDEVRYNVGANLLTFGASYEYQRAKTGYTMYGTGYYKYNSLSDFREQQAPLAFGYTYPYEGVNDPMSRATFMQTALYVQNEWRAADSFILTYGLRADATTWLRQVSTNASFYALEWTGHYYAGEGNAPQDYTSPRFDTGRMPSTRVQLSPRAGFNWSVNPQLVLRGGSGLFAGRVPLVFLTNIPNYSNMLQNTVMVSSDSQGVLSGLAGNFQSTSEGLRDYMNAQGYPMEFDSEAPVRSATICGVGGDFRLPQVWKSSLAVDYKLPLQVPVTVTLEAIYNKDINGVRTENLNLLHADNFCKFQGADNRTDYRHKLTNGSAEASSPLPNPEVTGGASLLTNTSKGYSYSLAFSLNAQPLKGLDFSLSYIYSQSRSVTDMVGSSLYSTWKNTPNVNSPNEEVLRNSSYSIPHKVTAALSYKFQTGKRCGTTLGLFYSGMNPGSFSYCFTNDMNGDGSSSDLIYIPASKEEIRFVQNGEYSPSAQQDAFWEYVCSDSYLSRHKGEYAGAAAALLPWLNRFDLRISEEIAFASSILDGCSLNIFCDLMNVGNLLHSAWGVEKAPTACNNGKVLTYVESDGEGPLYKLWSNSAGLLSHSFEPLWNNKTTWAIQLGFGLSF